MKIFFALALCFVLVAITNAQTMLQVRLAEEQPAIGLREAAVAHSDKKVYLHDSSVITNADVSDARVVSAGGNVFHVAISFTPQGAMKIADATQGHIGRPLAILVDGNVIAAPTVRDPIQHEAVLNGDWTWQEADEIARGLTGK